MPRGFRFNLQPVLDQRERIEEAKRLIVAELERERIRIEDRLRGYQRAIVAAKQDLSRQLGAQQARIAAPDAAERISVESVRMQAGASLRLVAQAQQTVLELAGLHKRLDAARLDLLDAATQKKAVELLREKRHEEWKQEQRRKENAELDEMTVMRHVRRDDETAGAAA
jgi:flagellar FliJ protein